MVELSCLLYRRQGHLSIDNRSIIDRVGGLGGGGGGGICGGLEDKLVVGKVVELVV